MTPLAVLTLLPLWAVTLAVGLTAARLGRRTGPGLLLLCLTQGAWVTGLLLLESGQAAWAERLLPGGMLMAGAFVHAAADMAGARRRWHVGAAWALSVAVALLGLLAPRLLYGPGARGMGPLFPPLAVASMVGTLAVKWHLLTLVRQAQAPRERRRRGALLVANVFGALGGGGAISLHITGLAPAGVAAPFLLASVLMAASAVLDSEDAWGRNLLRQGLVQGAVTAALSSLATLGLFVALPALVPGGQVLSVWGLAVTFLALLPLEPLRHLLAERVLARLFQRPLGVRELASAVEREQSRADQAERLAELGRVASAVAHEIRNPLGVILAELKLLERQGADVESVATVRAQVRRASQFMDDLLRYARPRELELADVDVGRAVGQAASEAARPLEGAGARLVLPQGQGPRIEADPRALGDVVRNLVSNALIATVGREGARVRVRLVEEEAHVRIEVEDDGPGVPRELAPRLFEPFVTGRGRDEQHPGTGLGLAISARLARRHGATLAHERPEAGGARFVARWPRRPRLLE